MTTTRTGGCQCGRVRYSAELDSDDAYWCHCKMCQKATGGIAAAFVQLPHAALRWEREPDWYQSSPIARRGFCSACGTPLAFDFIDRGKNLDLTVGSFDDPSAFKPILHAGSESIHEAWLDTRDLPRLYTATTDSVARRWKAAGRDVPE
ncbi:MAG TPA: GFA family protein [Novosphingobium sp.]|nr:GFA family protein [Novosphingobium sp.]